MAVPLFREARLPVESDRRYGTATQVSLALWGIWLLLGVPTTLLAADSTQSEKNLFTNPFSPYAAGIAAIILLEAGLIALLIRQHRILNRANKKLRASEATEGAILKSLEGHLAVLSGNGKIIEINTSWERFARAMAAPDEANVGIGANFLGICERAEGSSPDVVKALAGVQAVLKGTSPFFEMEFACDSENERRWFRMNVTPLQAAQGGVVIIYRDITSIKEAEMAIRESESRFRHVTDSAPVLVWMSGASKLCTYFNKPWLDFTGRPLKLELGNGWAEGVHKSDLEKCLATYLESFAARRPFKMEYRLRRFDGEYRWVYDVGVPRYDDQNTFLGYIGSCIDITDRKAAEAALRELGGRLLTAQEEERARIARELHDDLSQRMALLQIGLEELEQALPSGSTELHQSLQSIVQTAVGVSSDIHALSHQLHPAKLETLGLPASLRGLCREFSQQRNLQVEFVDKHVAREIPKDVALCLYRIAQEALRNIAKHSGASRAALELAGNDEQIGLAIMDSGAGFEPESAGQNYGIGLISMRERVRLVGGQLSVESKPNSGTRIYALVPLRDAASRNRMVEKAYVASD